MKKLKFISVIIVLLLFCPFIKQCDGINKRAEKTPTADTIVLEISKNEVFDESIENKETIKQPKEIIFYEVNKYFTEDSENVFEIAFRNGKTIIEDLTSNNKNIMNDEGFFSIFLFFLFSILLIFSTFLSLIYSFLEKKHKMKIFNILNLFFIFSIIIVFCFSGLLERFGQIKIGFYLLLLSNFYMLYLLKQKKEQIQL